MDDPTFRVSELAAAITAALERAFPEPVWVRGEIRNLTRAASGHVYFSLVDPDADARVDVTLFSGDKEAVNRLLVRTGAVRMADGVEIRIRGTVTHYARRGSTQLRMTWIDPEFTLGKLAAERERTIAALRGAGLLDRQRRLVLPPVPRRIALVTSAGSAAHADFVHELQRSGVSWEVALVDSRVQGPDAVDSLVAALELARRWRPDVIALVRGGGARSDLAVFDDIGLATAIAQLPIPVITGIGHEIDTSVADLVAHRAEKTPTACAAALVATVTGFLLRLDDAERTLRTATRRRLDELETTLDRATTRLASATRGRLAATAASVASLDRRTRLAARTRLRAAAVAVDHLADRIDAADPRRLLRRGFSITRTVHGELVRSADVEAGTDLRTTTAGGIIRSIVEEPPRTEGAP